MCLFLYITQYSQNIFITHMNSQCVSFRDYALPFGGSIHCRRNITFRQSVSHINKNFFSKHTSFKTRYFIHVLFTNDINITVFYQNYTNFVLFPYTHFQAQPQRDRPILWPIYNNDYIAK